MDDLVLCPVGRPKDVHTKKTPSDAHNRKMEFIEAN